MIQTMSHCCHLYNHLLKKCREAYAEGVKHPTEYELNKTVVALKKEHPEFLDVYSQVLANVSSRVSASFKGFFSRLKSREGNPGYPRFKSFSRYDSFTYPQFGFSIVSGRLNLSKIGMIRIAGLREFFGKMKTCTIKREGCAPNYRWKAGITYEYEDKSTVFLEDTREPVGLDLGLKNVVETSRGFRFVNPRHFYDSQKKFASIQKKMTLFEKGSVSWQKYHQRLYHAFTRLNNIRKAERYEVVNHLIGKHNLIAIEDIDVEQIQKKALGKQMRKLYSDASWAKLTETLCIKAAEAGCTVVKVRPEYTSQRCSVCGRLVPKTLSERRHVCICGFDIDRDTNASINVERLGLQALQLSYCEMEILGHTGRSQRGIQ